MKIIKVGNLGYITNIELSCGKLFKIDIGIDEQPITFKEEDIEYFITALKEHYKNKNVDIEIVVEDF